MKPTTTAPRSISYGGLLFLCAIVLLPLAAPGQVIRQYSAGESAPAELQPTPSGPRATQSASPTVPPARVIGAGGTSTILQSQPANPDLAPYLVAFTPRWASRAIFLPGRAADLLPRLLVRTTEDPATLAKPPAPESEWLTALGVRFTPPQRDTPVVADYNASLAPRQITFAIDSITSSTPGARTLAVKNGRIDLTQTGEGPGLLILDGKPPFAVAIDIAGPITIVREDAWYPLVDQLYRVSLHSLDEPTFRAALAPEPDALAPVLGARLAGNSILSAAEASLLYYGYSHALAALREAEHSERVSSRELLVRLHPTESILNDIIIQENDRHPDRAAPIGPETRSAFHAGVAAAIAAEASLPRIPDPTSELQDSTLRALRREQLLVLARQALELLRRNNPNSPLLTPIERDIALLALQRTSTAPAPIAPQPRDVSAPAVAPAAAHTSASLALADATCAIPDPAHLEPFVLGCAFERLIRVIKQRTANPSGVPSGTSPSISTTTFQGALLSRRFFDAYLILRASRIADGLPSEANSQFSQAMAEAVGEVLRVEGETYRTPVPTGRPGQRADRPLTAVDYIPADWRSPLARLEATYGRTLATTGAPRPPAGSAPASARAVALPAATRILLAELLAVRALDLVHERGAVHWLGQQARIQHDEDRFCRWRAYADATREGRQDLLAYELETSASLPRAAALDDLALDAFRRLRPAEAWPPYRRLLESEPERARLRIPYIRQAFHARLVQLCEEQRFADALNHALLSQKLPGRLLDFDLATVALSRQLESGDSATAPVAREALLKFLLNHRAWSQVLLTLEYAARDKRSAQAPSLLAPSYRALAECELNRHDTALALLRQANANHPPDPAFFYVLGLLTERYRNLPTIAERCYLQTLDLDPDFAPAQLALARLDHTVGNTSAALVRLDDLLRRHPDILDALRLRGRVALADGNIPAALADLQRVADSDRSTLSDILALAHLHIDSGNPAEASALLCALAAEYPESPAVAVVQSRLAHAVGNTSAEANALLRLLRITTPWRLENFRAAREHEFAVRRLRELGFEQNISATAVVTSRRANSTVGTVPEPRRRLLPQAAWAIPHPPTPTERVESRLNPAWISLSPTFDPDARPRVWRNFATATTPQAIQNVVELRNHGTGDLLAIRVFIDDQEFAWLDRLAPGASLSLQVITPNWPDHISLACTNAFGVYTTLRPEALLLREPEPGSLQFRYP